MKGREKIMEKIKIIIADDDVHFCTMLKNYLQQFDDFDILGLAHTDSEEIFMIENLKPNVVITDLVRNKKYSGLDIIKKYSKKEKAPQFFIISADRKEDVINKDEDLNVLCYIKKPFFEYYMIVQELRKNR